jgi:hypothetical protein
MPAAPREQKRKLVEVVGRLGVGTRPQVPAVVVDDVDRYPPSAGATHHVRLVRLRFEHMLVQIKSREHDHPSAFRFGGFAS